VKPVQPVKRAAQEILDPLVKPAKQDKLDQVDILVLVVQRDPLVQREKPVVLAIQAKRDKLDQLVLQVKLVLQVTPAKRDLLDQPDQRDKRVKPV
jgi:hypothetical protein